MGRPSSFTQEQADEICEWIADGGSLRSYCAQDGKPSTTTVKRWLADVLVFRAQYAQAREAQAESYADIIIDIADNSDIPSDQKRVMIDARKWVASKLLPKKYGDKIDVTSGGEPLKGYAVVDPSKTVFSGEQS